MKRSPLKRKTPLAPTQRSRPKVIYRQLQPGEAPPAGEPRRYTDGRGYIRLRWKGGTNEYVEVYEHRLVCGVPPSDVHHLDHDKGNNSPDNLEPLPRDEHLRRHGREATARSRRLNEWDGYPSQQAHDKAQQSKERRAQRQAFLTSIAELYQSGKTTSEIAEQVGRHAGTVSIALRAAGVAARHVAGRNTDISNAVRQLVHARAGLRCERCSANLAWGPRHVHHRRPRQMGGSRKPETNLPGNLVLLCTDCHLWVESYRELARAQGWLVASSAEPALQPIEHGLFGRCFLLNDGTWSAGEVDPEAAMRGPARRTHANSVDLEEVRRLHAAGVRAGEMMRRLKVSRHRLYEAFDELGLPRFRPGRPAAAGEVPGGDGP